MNAHIQEILCTPAQLGQNWNVSWNRVPELDLTEMGATQIPRCFMAECYNAFRIEQRFVWDSELILVLYFSVVKQNFHAFPHPQVKTLTCISGSHLHPFLCRQARLGKQCFQANWDTVMRAQLQPSGPKGFLILLCVKGSGLRIQWH